MGLRISSAAEVLGHAQQICVGFKFVGCLPAVISNGNFFLCRVTPGCDMTCFRFGFAALDGSFYSRVTPGGIFCIWDREKKETYKNRNKKKIKNEMK